METPPNLPPFRGNGPALPFSVPKPEPMKKSLLHLAALALGCAAALASDPATAARAAAPAAHAAQAAQTPASTPPAPATPEPTVAELKAQIEKLKAERDALATKLDQQVLATQLVIQQRNEFSAALYNLQAEVQLNRQAKQKP